MRRSGLLLALLAQIALAAPPVITELRPRGAELGRPFTLVLNGRNIGEGARVISDMPASWTLVTSRWPLRLRNLKTSAPSTAITVISPAM